MREYSLLTLDNVGSHQSRRVVVALEVSGGQVPLDLHGEEVPGVLLLQLAGVGDVELHHEPQHRLGGGQANLLVHWFVWVQPELK